MLFVAKTLNYLACVEAGSLSQAIKTSAGSCIDCHPHAGARIAIEDDDAQQWLDCVIECTWNKEQQTWKFLRDRRDKETPNAFHVYEKVMKSIEDNINEEILLGAINEALQNSVYDRDRQKSSEQVP